MGEISDRLYGLAVRREPDYAAHIMKLAEQINDASTVNTADDLRNINALWARGHRILKDAGEPASA